MLSERTKLLAMMAVHVYTKQIGVEESVEIADVLLREMESRQASEPAARLDPARCPFCGAVGFPDCCNDRIESLKSRPQGEHDAISG